MRGMKLSMDKNGDDSFPHSLLIKDQPVKGKPPWGWMSGSCVGWRGEVFWEKNAGLHLDSRIPLMFQKSDVKTSYKLVVYEPIISRVWDTSQVVQFFFHQQYDQKLDNQRLSSATMITRLTSTKSLPGFPWSVKTVNCPWCWLYTNPSFWQRNRLGGDLLFFLLSLCTPKKMLWKKCFCQYFCGSWFE